MRSSTKVLAGLLLIEFLLEPIQDKFVLNRSQLDTQNSG